MNASVEQLLQYVRKEHVRSLKGIEEARAVNPERFDECIALFVAWATRALGDSAIKRTVDAFAQFSTDVNMAQARYEADGHYENKSYQECFDSVYNEQETMDDYLWGVYLTNLLWSHHFDITLFFEDRFLKKLPENAAIVEIAPGHGAWGLFALHRLPTARVDGFDISPSSMAIARSLATAAGFDNRARYSLKNALELGTHEAGTADAVICSFLIEHLETPEKLMENIHHLLKPGAIAFVSGALTAAQVDHIYEFKRESELVLMAEKYGMRVMQTLSVAPQRTLPGAKFLPRSMSLILQRRTKDYS